MVKKLPIESTRTFRIVADENFQELAKGFNDAVETVSNKAFDKVVGAAKIEWLPPVNTFEDLETTYPDVVEGKTVMTRDSGKIYRFDGENWIEIQNIDPSAINEVENRLTAELSTNGTRIEELGTNVMAYGAKGDIVTDDTLSLQNFLIISRTTQRLFFRKIKFFNYKTN